MSNSELQVDAMFWDVPNLNKNSMNKTSKKKTNSSKLSLSKTNCFLRRKPKRSIFNYFKMTRILVVSWNRESFKVSKIKSRTLKNIIKGSHGGSEMKIKSMPTEIKNSFQLSLMC